MKRPGSALVVEAALVDGKVRDSGARLDTIHARLLHQADETTSPLARARLLQRANEVLEVSGALRYSAVTGTDDSDLG